MKLLRDDVEGPTFDEAFRHVVNGANWDVRHLITSKIREGFLQENAIWRSVRLEMKEGL